MKRAGIIAISMTIGVMSCKVKDGDRCHDGLVYNKTVGVCEDADAGTADNSSDGDGKGDAGTTTFGTPCFENADCIGEVDYCLLNPLEPDAAGMCSIICEPGDCPDGYQCCDCSIFGFDIACTPDEGAATAAANGCTCS